MKLIFQSAKFENSNASLKDTIETATNARTSSARAGEETSARKSTSRPRATTAEGPSAGREGPAAQHSAGRAASSIAG